MKRIFAILTIIAAVLSSCQDEITLNPAASLFTAQPELTDTTAIFRLAVANVADSTKEITFPVVFGGTAEHGVDYTVSSDAFVFGGKSPVDSIVVTTLRFGTEKTLSMSVQLPDNFEEGKYLSSEFTLQDKFVYISFSKDYAITTDSLDIGFMLTNKRGSSKTIKNDIEVFLRVNTEKSTALEGTDFIFSDSTRFVIKAGESAGSLELKSLNNEPETGRDKIVLDMEFGEHFGVGQIHEIVIDLLDPKWKELEGTWSPDSLVTDSTYFKKHWEGICSGFEDIPNPYGMDEISFDMADYTFDPSFYSAFRNFFTEASPIKKGRLIEMELPDGSIAPVQTFLLGNTNRYFSKTEESEDDESYIGLRLVSGEEEQQLLDFYVLDHTSRSFMPELETEGRYASEKPVAASPGLYINMVFTKEQQN